MRPGTLLRWHALKRTLKSEIKNNSTVLDIGSYDGFASGKLTEIYSNLNIILVDLDMSGLVKAKQKNLYAIYGSALNLPVGDSTVDVVLCLDLIEHIDDDSKVIEEISRVLRKDGRFILTTPKENGVSFPLLDRKRTLEINKGWGHVRLGYSKNQIESLLHTHNLTSEKTSGYFNLLTRLTYPSVMTPKNFRSKFLIYKFIVSLEPYIKYGADEHIIIGGKRRQEF